MDVKLTDEQQAFARQAIASGRLASEEAAVQEGLRLWVEYERKRMELLSLLDEAETSIARGDGIEVTPESMHALIERVKERSRHRSAVSKAS